MIKIEKIAKFRMAKSLTFLIALVCLSTIFIGCKDDDDPVIQDTPVIAISSPTDGASHISGTEITLAFTANSSNGLKKIEVKFKSATGTEMTKLDTTLGTQPESFSFSRKFSVGPIGTETYTITVTDKRDNIQTKSVNVKSVTGFGTEDFGTIYNKLGTKAGAFDLAMGEQRLITDSDSDKDMENTDSLGVFTGGWMAENSTRFVKTLAFNYNNGTSNEAKNIYSSGSPSAFVSTPVNGDIFIARLRGTETYVVIRIVTNDPTNDECGCTNKGKLTFNFKKSE